MKKKLKKKFDHLGEGNKFPLPIYDNEEDIYRKGKEESLIDDDQPGKRRPSADNKNPGEDLDVAGAELDDVDEAIGEEDEENNYYSLGGDNHDDLEEARE